MVTQEGREEAYEAEASEGSFVSAVSRAAPAGSVVSDMEYASVVDEPLDDLDETIHDVVSRLYSDALCAASACAPQCVQASSELSKCRCTSVQGCLSAMCTSLCLLIRPHCFTIAQVTVNTMTATVAKYDV